MTPVPVIGIEDTDAPAQRLVARTGRRRVRGLVVEDDDDDPLVGERPLATGDDAGFVKQFLNRLLAEDEEGRFDDESDFGMRRFRGQLNAFRKGFKRE